MIIADNIQYEIILSWSKADGAFIADIRSFQVARPMGRPIRKLWRTPKWLSGNGQKLHES